MNEKEIPENKSCNGEEENEHPVYAASESDVEEMSESESELPEEPDWCALEENAFSAD